MPESDFPYTYEFPLPEVESAPQPSNADYSDQNCAWLVEMLAASIGRTKEELILRYENNSKNPDDAIYVRHPRDRTYYDEAVRRGQEGSPEMQYYNTAAKKSARLRTFMENSPAGITYFQGSETDLPPVV